MQKYQCLSGYTHILLKYSNVKHESVNKIESINSFFLKKLKIFKVLLKEIFIFKFSYFYDSFKIQEKKTNLCEKHVYLIARNAYKRNDCYSLIGKNSWERLKDRCVSVCTWVILTSNKHCLHLPVLIDNVFFQFGTCYEYIKT